MTEFGLPHSLMVNGKEQPIRWEYTAVLDAISAMNDRDLEDREKLFAALYIIYENFEDMPKEDYKAAFDELVKFINNGLDEGKKSQIKTVDFEQDYRIMIPAINRVAGKEIRGEDGIHWWTFLGWFMEIGECTYGTVLNIRNKRNKGKKLEKWEQEFFDANKDMVLIKAKRTQEEIEMDELMNKLWNS